jgi:hypothetical protein
MFDTYIPVDTEQDIQKLATTESSRDLAQYLPQLHGSYTNGTNDALQWIEENEEKPTIS